MAKHKCKIPDPPADTSRWMGTYGDMVTLLMAFFVMLFAVSETNNQKFVAFVSGLAGPFDNPALELGLVDGSALEDNNPSPISMIAPVSGGRTEISTSGEIDTPEKAARAEAVAQSELQLAELGEDLREVLEAVEAPMDIDIRPDERGLVVAISTDEILFEIGSAQLSQVGRELIGSFAPLLVNAPNTIVVEGHTDNTPLNRAGYSNWNLSTDRAVAVLQLLGEAHGMPYDRISATGYGEWRPLVPNDTPENRAINRRVEVLIVGMHLSQDGAPVPPPQQAAAGPTPADPTAPAAPPPAEDMTASAPESQNTESQNTGSQTSSSPPDPDAPAQPADGSGSSSAGGDSGDDFAPPSGERPQPIDPGADPNLPGQVAAANMAGATGGADPATLATIVGQ